MEYLAHISEDGHTQTVLEHLENTAELCAGFAKAFGAEEQGRLIGKAHDIGKCSDAFQKRLSGGHIVDHATAGAVECAKQNAIWAAGCVAGHHGGLPDFGNLKNDTDEDATLFGRLKRGISGKIPSYISPVALSKAPNPNHYGKDNLTNSYIIRMLYSCLVDADYLDTEQFMSNGSHRESAAESIPVLCEKLKRYIEPWWNPTNELNKKRCEILRACIEEGTQGKGVYTLTVPTGGGKTIASMAFSLVHAKENAMDRVIYVIPYTSIIEQTAAIFRNVFGKENVIEHHSNAGYENKANGSTAQYKPSRAIENWDAPIIVTTAVQFFESIYANRSSKCRKLHNIANSVIVFDEAQMLPTDHLRPCVAAIAKLVELFGSTAVLCTATQPVLNDLFMQYISQQYTIKELCPKMMDMYAAFKRVSIINIGNIDIAELVIRLEELPQVLCIVNSRKPAQEIFDRLSEEGSFHLSTLMYPAHRRSVLSEIRLRLKEGKPCRVISTSLIEAGVDVDFPAVFREMTGLDSILQAAGRCNREGKHPAESSIVTVFEGVSNTPQLLKVNIGAAREVIGSEVDATSPETIEKYFKAYRSLAGTRLDRAEVISSFENGIQGRMLPFCSVAEKFHLINDNTKTIYIPLEKGERLVQRLSEGEHSRELFRELGQYCVNVYENQFYMLMGINALTHIDDNSAILKNTQLYDNTVGLDVNDVSNGCLIN